MASAGNELFYYPQDYHEVDWEVRGGGMGKIIQVKSGPGREAQPGLGAYTVAQGAQRQLQVGGDGIALEVFLRQPVTHWMAR